MSRSALQIPVVSLCLGLALSAHGHAGEAPDAPAKSAEISWRPFDTAALKAAKDQGKPILLWMPVPWGHWDTLMAQMTFRDPRVVSLATEKFVPVREDPLLRPDVYARYGMGGWPTTTFVLASGNPLYFPDPQGRILRAGGTYYAPAAMAAYMEEVLRYLEANKDLAEKAAAEIGDSILQRKEVGKKPLTPEILEVSVTKIMAAYESLLPDPELKVSRHPDADSALLAFHYYLRKRNKQVMDVMVQTLTDMARGGIRDHLGGGFHRYATDAAWHMPAFEKLLGVNAELLEAYVALHKMTGSTRYQAVGEDVVRYVTGTLADPAGWFYAYQAADAAPGQDGDYYTWTLNEVKEALSEEEQKILIPAFDIQEWGEMLDSAPRRNVLFLKEGPILLSQELGLSEQKISEVLASGREKLLRQRSTRTAPPVGKILVTDAAAEMSSALIHAGDAWRRDDLRQAGLRALDFLWDNARDPNSGLMDHVWTPASGRSGGPDLFGDQVYVLRALVDAYESTGDVRYLERAEPLSRTASGVFSDSLEGGFQDRVFSADAAGLLSWPRRSLRDNALFADALVRLHHLTGEPEGGPYQAQARKVLESWADEYAKHAEAASPYGLAADRLLSPPLEVIVVGAPSDEGYDQALLEARALYHPWKVLRRVPPAQAETELKARQVAVVPRGAASLLCLGQRCAGPFDPKEKLLSKMQEFLDLKKEPPAAAATGPGSGDGGS